MAAASASTGALAVVRRSTQPTLETRVHEGKIEVGSSLELARAGCYGRPVRYRLLGLLEVVRRGWGGVGRPGEGRRATCGPDAECERAGVGRSARGGSSG